MTAPDDLDRLELFARGVVSIRFDVQRDGQPLTGTDVLYQPFQTSFALDGTPWRIGPHVAGGTGWDLLRSALKGGVGYGAFALRQDGLPAVATARQRGPWDFGFDLTLDGAPARLDTDPQRSRFEFHGAAGRGSCERMSDGRRGHVAMLPARLPQEQQLFIALLAASRWYRLDNTH